MVGTGLEGCGGGTGRDREAECEKHVECEGKEALLGVLEGGRFGRFSPTELEVFTQTLLVAKSC